MLVAEIFLIPTSNVGSMITPECVLRGELPVLFQTLINHHHYFKCPLSRLLFKVHIMGMCGHQINTVSDKKRERLFVSTKTRYISEWMT